MRIKKIPLTIPTRQYAVRRIEFDDWMVRRSKAELHRHRVMKIEQTGEGFIIDGLFQAEFLVGAGGTRCPVAEYFFKDRTHENGRSNIKDRKIAALEEEVEADGQNKSCRLWFFEEGLAGYSWLVPKEGGFAAIGVGGLLDRINQTGNRIWDFWEHHIKRLEAAGLIREQKHVPRGHVYLRRWKNGQTQPVQKGRVLITGDAAGLATRDMGEGIEPAVESGIRAARSIITGAGYSVSGIKKYSLPAIVFPPKLP
ncbi:MAG: NAD(P)/FAD-dependent oxidoreductase [Spirochaetota bacterium]|nr:NAD(P)/FAD-dependent oxidoreductase [Spirochaetota bacterium]